MSFRAKQQPSNNDDMRKTRVLQRNGKFQRERGRKDRLKVNSLTMSKCNETSEKGISQVMMLQSQSQLKKKYIRAVDGTRVIEERE